MSDSISYRRAPPVPLDCPRCGLPYFYSLDAQRDLDPDGLCWALPDRNPTKDTVSSCVQRGFVAKLAAVTARAERAEAQVASAADVLTAARAWAAANSERGRLMLWVSEREKAHRKLLAAVHAMDER